MKAGAMSRLNRKMAVPILLLLLSTLIGAASSFAQSDEEMDVLRMVYRDQDLVTPSRTAKPVSQVAENVTVITAEEIEALNAHTLKDLLCYVTGIQVDSRGGPGSNTNVLIQGSDTRHVQVVMDGVSLNNLADDFAEIGALPVQQIDRVEIVKGPASSAWGSALGGIINIITKSPDPDRRFGGTISAGGGEKGTGDFRAETSGTAGSAGYYLYAGGLTSDGLTPDTPFDGGNLYGKLQWRADPLTRLQLSLFYNRWQRGEGRDLANDFAFRGNAETLFTTLAVTRAIGDTMSLEVSGRFSRKRAGQSLDQLSSGLQLASKGTDDLTGGGSAKLTWKSGAHNLLVGTDVDSGRLESLSVAGGKQRQTRWAFFANDTLALGRFSVTPGLRYDRTDTNGDFASPSLGVTCRIFEQTILRAYAARGFNIPPLALTSGDGFFFRPNPGLRPEEVRSYSAGVETPVSRFLWLKTTLFLHDIRNVLATESLSGGRFTEVNQGKQRRQGVEAELKTAPVFHTALLAGVAFVDATDRETGQRIPDKARYTCDLGLDYDDGDALRGALRGHYVWWIASPGDNGRYRTFIWDLSLSRKIFETDATETELFFTGHNLFNGAQHLGDNFANPRRWFEGGVRFRF